MKVSHSTPALEHSPSQEGGFLYKRTMSFVKTQPITFGAVSAVNNPVSQGGSPAKNPARLSHISLKSSPDWRQKSSNQPRQKKTVIPQRNGLMINKDLGAPFMQPQLQERRSALVAPVLNKIKLKQKLKFEVHQHVKDKISSLQRISTTATM